MLVVDLVESVRLMQTWEADTIARWRGFVRAVRTEVLPPRGGQLVKSLGDGLLMEFEAVSAAAAAAAVLHRMMHAQSADLPAAQQLRLRAGLHVADVVIDDELDVLGAGVNLAARLATLARAGETVLSVQARDELTDTVDARLEDLGPCWLKNLSEPVHAFRATDPALAPEQTAADPGVIAATLAILPLDVASDAPGDAVIGDVLADGLIAELSRCDGLAVLSRLSTAAAQGRGLAIDTLCRLLGARYVVSGSVLRHHDQLRVSIELLEAGSREVVWADRHAAPLSDLFNEDGELVRRLADGLRRAVSAREAEAVSRRPLPSLDSFTLLYGGIGLLHRVSPGHFHRAREVLGLLADRVPRHAAAHAWLGQWHCLRLARGLSEAGAQEGLQARQRVMQALDADPDSALAWALRGLVASWVDGDLDGADQALERARDQNPNEPLAWLYTAALRSWQGRGDEAAEAARRVRMLSPLDPMQYYVDTMCAAAHLAADQLDTAIEHCRRGLRLNHAHTPLHRVLAIAQVKAGDETSARQTIARMRTLQPELTVSRFMALYPGRHHAHAAEYGRCLAQAGLPP